MINKDTKQRFNRWWRHDKSDRPLIRLIAEREEPLNRQTLVDLSGVTDPEMWWADPELHVDWTKNSVNTCEYLYDAIPYIDLNYGPGSMAAYLGITPQFRTETVWYDHIRADELSDIPFPVFKRNAEYLVRHLSQVRETVRLSGGRFPVCIPDILENIDILALLRGNEQCCFDLMDEPDEVKRYLGGIADIYMKYYDLFYNEVRFGKSKRESMYTAFGIWAEDKVAKIQCDFSCLLSRGQFDEFILPHLRRQTEEIPYTMYHLDGKDAVHHIKSIVGLKDLNALQWTPGAGQPDGGSQCWYPIYDAAAEAGKSVWVGLEDGCAEEMAEKAARIAERYDNTGVYFFVLPTVKAADKKFFTDIFGA